jgi:hypothetical protein
MSRKQVCRRSVQLCSGRDVQPAAQRSVEPLDTTGTSQQDESERRRIERQSLHGVQPSVAPVEASETDAERGQSERQERSGSRHPVAVGQVPAIGDEGEGVGRLAVARSYQ